MSGKPQQALAEWMDYWKLLAEREVKSAMKYIRKHAGVTEQMSTLLATLPAPQRELIQRGLEMKAQSTRMLINTELTEALSLALAHADTGVQLGDKPRIVK